MRREFRATRRGAAVLPHDGSVQRLTGLSIPRDDRLALIGDTDRRDWLIDRPRHIVEHGDGESPYLGRVVFDPARIRVVLREFAIRTCPRMALVVDSQRANATGTSVDSDHGHEVVSVV